MVEHPSSSTSERLIQAYRIARLGHWEWNQGGSVLTWSPEMYEIWGIDPNDGPPPVDDWLGAIPREDSEMLLSRAEAASEVGQRFELEHRVLRPDGAVRWVLTTAVREEGEVIVGTAQDISARREFEEQLRQSQKMEAVGRLAGGVAHDFNNILTAIFSYTEFALEEMHPADESYSDLSEVLKAAERARELTAHLLAFSRRRTISPRVANVNTVISNLVHMLKRALGEDIQFESHLDSDLWMTTVDPSALEQVIVNLALNARDAMPRGGHLIVETSNVVLDASAGASRAESIEPGEYVAIAVTDTGRGMDRELQQRIFEPFFTTKTAAEGTGLGLSTCYGIVRQARGYILVYSEVDKGSTFRVYLPRTIGADEAPTPKRDAKEDLRGTESILVVEDDDQVRTLTVRALSRYGYTTIGAASGDQALEILADATEPFDLLLTDVVMPKMSGSELAREVARLYPDMRVLFMSGYTEHHIVTKGVLDEGVQLLQKPFTPDRLGRAVRETLDGSVETKLR